MRVEFYLVDAMEVANFTPIYRALEARGVDARMVAVRGDAHSANKGWFDYDNAVEILKLHNIPHSAEPDHDCDAAVTTQRSLLLRGYKGLKIRLMYTVGLYESEELQETRARGFDAVLVQGPYAQTYISRWLDPARVIVTGFPKYDDFFSNPPAAAIVKQKLGLAQNEKIVAYFPTWESRSSVDLFYGTIEELAAAAGVQLLIKAHHCTPRFEPERYERLRRSESARLLPTNFPSAELFTVADLVIVDALSGVLGEAILIDPERALICLCPNMPLLESQMDPSLRGVCPILTRPADLLAIARDQLRYGERDMVQLHARRATRDRLFAFTDGTAAGRAAEAIIDLVEAA